MPKPILVSPASYSYSYGYARDVQVLTIAADYPTTFRKGDVRLRWTKRGIVVKGLASDPWYFNNSEFLADAEVVALFQDGTAFAGTLDAFGEEFAVHERRENATLRGRQR